MDRFLITVLCFALSIKAFANLPLEILPSWAENLSDQSSLSSQSSLPPLRISPLITLQSIQLLRKAGKLQEAKRSAEQYLKQYPDDVDVILILGLIYAQEENTTEAEKCFNKVLQKMPQYMDARIALIRLKIKNKQLLEASRLIKIGLWQDPKRPELIQFNKVLYQKENSNIKEIPTLKETDNNNTKIKPETKPDNSSNSSILADIQTLRKEGHLELAKEKALNYLSTNPDDPDISLLLGLIYLQQKNYLQAETYFSIVLKHTPNYLDARLGFIRAKIATNDFTGAKLLLEQGLKLTPANPELEQLAKNLSYLTSEKAVTNIKHKKIMARPVILSMEERYLKQANYYLQQQQFSKSEAIFIALVARYPTNIKFLLALVDFYLSRHNDMAALILIRERLVNEPSTELFIKKGEIHTLLHQYALAVRSYRQAMALGLDNKKGEGLIAEVQEISPRSVYGVNEIGVWTDNSYVSDVHSIWDYSTLYYKRDTDFGSAVAKINYASRLHNNANQYEIDFSPRFNRNVYMDLATAYSNKPEIFPNFMMAAEGYVNIPNFFELSAGGKYSKIKQTYFATYTSSLNLYPGNYWISFRPYYFVPRNSALSSLLYTANVRRYLSNDDHFIGIGFGTGHSPDLADLLTTNFFIIKNSFVNMSYEFPILNHRIIVDLNAGYQRWQYPSDLVRNLYNGAIGLKYRF